MKIHSFESFGTVDGPGIRFIVFTQGCPLRCLYCHNPDTWNIDNSPQEMTPTQLITEVKKYRSYIKSGGVTVSGGEPLLQASEVADFFALCRKEKIHTALDTAGVILNDEVKRLLSFTDLVLLDIKSIDVEQYTTITKGGSLNSTLKFLDYLEAEGIKTWIRHVVVPDYTDDDGLLRTLADRLKGYSVIECIELLPYHSMATPKYDILGLDYPLKDTEALSKSRIEEIKPIFAQWRCL